MKVFSLIGYFLCSVLLSAHTNAGELPAYSLPNSEVRSLHAQANNKDYDLYIQLPNSYKDSTQNYPLLLVTDSRFAFPIAAGAMQLMGDRVVKEAIVVGVSYSKGDDYTISRTRDYTPTFSPKEKSAHSDEARAVSGHAKEFAQFLSEQVIPELKKYYRIDDQHKIFVGHSFGGLLGAYILVHQPELFDHYIIGSPSLWYDNKVLLKMEAAYAASHKDLKAQAMIYVDADESGENSMVTDVNIFAAGLRSRHYQNLNLYVEVIKNENHHSVFPGLLSKGLMRAIPLKN